MDSDIASQTDARRFVVRRLVADFRDGRLKRGIGAAAWRPDGRMTESLIFDGFEARRETLWQDEEGGGLRLHFADGLPLVAVSPRERAALHHCGEDVYAARLYRYDDGEIVLGWRVRGPRKDYAMITRYRREGADR